MLLGSFPSKLGTIDIFEKISSAQKDGDFSVMKSAFTDNDIRKREDDQVQVSKSQVKLCFL